MKWTTLVGGCGREIPVPYNRQRGWQPQEHAVKEKGRQDMGTQLAGGLEDAQPAGVMLGACGDKRAGRWWLLGGSRGLWPCAPRL